MAGARGCLHNADVKVEYGWYDDTTDDDDIPLNVKLMGTQSPSDRPRSTTPTTPSAVTDGQSKDMTMNSNDGEEDLPADTFAPSAIKIEPGDDYDLESRLQDFDGMDIPDVSNFKSEYDLVYADYFAATAHHMPADDYVKTEPVDSEETTVKTELREDEYPDGEGRRQREERHKKKKYKCRLCEKVMTSRYEFYRHITTHEVKCVNCHCVYKQWKDLENHEVHCTRRYGRTIIAARSGGPPPKKKPLPYSCSLCKRRYENAQHLFDHQVKRCKKRYVKRQWVVKI
jgi:hypothetical protein